MKLSARQQISTCPKMSNYSSNMNQLQWLLFLWWEWGELYLLSKQSYVWEFLVSFTQRFFLVRVFNHFLFPRHWRYVSSGCVANGCQSWTKNDRCWTFISNKLLIWLLPPWQTEIRLPELSDTFFIWAPKETVFLFPELAHTVSSKTFLAN